MAKMNKIKFLSKITDSNGYPYASRDADASFKDSSLVDWDATSGRLRDSGYALADVLEAIAQVSPELCVVPPHAEAVESDHIGHKRSTLTKVLIPNSATSIGINAFDDCTALTEFTVPEQIEEIQEGAFFHCTALNNIDFGEGRPLVIGREAFSGCSSLRNVLISTSVKEIGDYAFYECDSLNTVSFTEQVISIGNGAFYGCEALSSIHTIGDIVQEDTIPRSVTSIGEFAFAGSSELDNAPRISRIRVPNTASLGEGVFQNCPQLASFSVYSDPGIPPTGGQDIPRLAFANCTQLSDVNIDSCAKKIGTAAFSNCSNLSRFTMPSSITELSVNAFANCTKMINGEFNPDTLDISAGIVFLGSQAQFENEIYIDGAAIGLLHDDAYLGACLFGEDTAKDLKNTDKLLVRFSDGTYKHYNLVL